MKISVIIPCYNVEKYIRECLDMLLMQTIRKECLEIILVDDCSTDGTLDILREYENLYEDNIILIPCEENGHQGTARNIGLMYASGDYISFVDGDDFIHLDTYHVLTEIMEKTNADIAQFRFGYKPEELEKEDKINCSDYKVYDYLIDDNRLKFFNDYRILNGSCTTKLYRRSLLEEAQVCFAEGVCYEEPLFTIPLKLYVKKAVVVEKRLYYYRTNPQGTTISTMQKSKAIAGHIETQYQTYTRLKAEGKYQALKNEIDLYFLRAFYCEPFYFLHQRQMSMSVELYRMICDITQKLLPEHKEVAKQLNGKDAKLYDFFGLKYIDNSLISNLMDYALCGTNNLSLSNSIICNWLLAANEAMEAYELKQYLLDDKFYENNNYNLLYSLFHLRTAIDDSEKAYLDLYENTQGAAKNYVKNKLFKNEKIVVAFLPISAAQWPAENVYRMLEKDDRFEPVIIPMPQVDRDEDVMNRTFCQVIDYFQKGSYNLIQVYDVKEKRIKRWDEIGGIPDIIVHLTSWDNVYPEYYRASSYPLRCQQYYIPYSTYVGNNKDGTYPIINVINKDIINMCTSVFVDSRINYEQHLEYQLLHGKNIVYSGYSKMDYFYDKHIFAADEMVELWGNKASDGNLKRIIIAPHYSVGISSEASAVAYSTFEKNYKYWSKLIDEYKDKAIFLFKPHPNLAKRAVECGLFKSLNEYEEYLDKLRRFENCVVCEESSYLEYFYTSDAMIMDSASFIIEYLYANKPLLFLTKENQLFNKFGEKAMEVHYKCSGDDYDGIHKFIDEVVINEADSNRADREMFFKEYLDYYSYNKRKASERIFDEIVKNMM